ncbi:type VI secretion system baseplate subunit TssF, partial [Klebsiella michiganensis]|uniref:type VI secretion system baseplate subunit TssF n=1 Tax=Klebsiella michiganensis TaxID=1134687 RepID=UPI003F57C3B5
AGERLTAAMQVFMDCIRQSGKTVEKLDKTLIDHHIAELDYQISRQLDAVMHHPEFQKVESLWRGLKQLVDSTDYRQNVKTEILDVSKDDLRQDFEDAPELIQSGLYWHTYTAEYDTPGGEPIGSVISAYEFDASPQDVALLRNISGVSAAAHMPFIGAVGPAFFLKESMEEVAAIKDIGNYFDRAEYIKWKSFRDTDDARYIGLVMPRVLGRLPYGPDIRFPGDADRRPLDARFAVCGFSREEALLPECGSFSGYQLLLEYFTFREKFMSVTLRGLENMDFPEELAWFEIDIVLERQWPHEYALSEKHLRLHCTPVINLFPLESDPLHLDSLQTEYLLRPMRVQDGHTEIYSVDSVTSSRHSGHQTYVPFTSFRHKGGMLRHDAPEYYYHTRVKSGPSGLHDTWLTLGGEAFDNHTVPENEKLSLSLTGTNGQLPRRALQSTLLDTVVKSTTARIQVRNLCAPTLPCYPPDRDRFHWRVLSHLGSSFLWMMDNADVLRGALALYDWTDNEMNRRRLEAIVDVRHSEVERFAQGHFLRGVQIEVTLDSSGFAGHGDICLFGEMLNRFFALYTDIHLFNHLILILQPGGERLEWQENHNRRIPG